MTDTTKARELATKAVELTDWLAQSPTWVDLPDSLYDWHSDLVGDALEACGLPFRDDFDLDAYGLSVSNDFDLNGNVTALREWLAANPE